MINSTPFIGEPKRQEEKPMTARHVPAHLLSRKSCALAAVAAASLYFAPAIQGGETTELHAADWPAQHAQCQAVPLTKVQVRGYLGKRIDRNPASILLALESPIPKGFEAAVLGTRPPTYRLAADSDLYKWLEGACYVFARTQDREIRKQIDRIAGLIVKCQDDDGYINTQRSKKRWDPGVKHDLYIAGHFFEADLETRRHGPIAV